jgi:predicted transposase
MNYIIRNMQRTIRIQLQPEEETIKVLTQTIEQYTWSFNAVCQLGWDSSITNGVALHKETYYDHRTITGLPSQLVCAARVKATEALKSTLKLLKQKKTVSCPKFKHCPIRYDVAALFARM